MRLLVLNSGSSSIKYCVLDMADESPLFSGKIERIGESDSLFVDRAHFASADAQEQIEHRQVVDHATGLSMIFDRLRDNEAGSEYPFHAAAHRVVHGGGRFKQPVIIDDSVMEVLEKTIPLAPLHNPPSLSGIKVTQRNYPGIRQVAVFDTSFFASLPARAYRYAIPDRLYREHNIRRFGFHGISHRYVAAASASYLKRPLEKLRLITVHLGNGASASAIDKGLCIDTSMGMTPTEGLVMGSRCGDLDPSLHFYLARTAGMGIDEIETMLNNQSGLKGLCGCSDIREVHKLADAGDERARLAIDIYCYRVSKYIGAYVTVLGGLDALVYTGGVGENDPVVRQLICDRLSVLGIALDHKKNNDCTGKAGAISSDASRAKVVVIPANEELEIARQTSILLRSHKT
ncbi:MAG: acetate kinase [Halobacteria archaeon]|nr:acetate kinase [Halobacteria archaeon]